VEGTLFSSSQELPFHRNGEGKSEERHGKEDRYEGDEEELKEFNRTMDILSIKLVNKVNRRESKDSWSVVVTSADSTPAEVDTHYSPQRDDSVGSLAFVESAAEGSDSILDRVGHVFGRNIDAGAVTGTNPN
jgi:hypothetical protein